LDFFSGGNQQKVSAFAAMEWIRAFELAYSMIA
jgi:hypothetical protein